MVLAARSKAQGRVRFPALLVYVLKSDITTLLLRIDITGFWIHVTILCVNPQKQKGNVLKVTDVSMTCRHIVHCDVDVT